MTLAEASRQYQAALEHHRRTRTTYDGITSAQTDLNDSATELNRAHSTLFAAWANQR